MKTSLGDTKHLLQSIHFYLKDLLPRGTHQKSNSDNPNINVNVAFNKSSEIDPELFFSVGI